MKTAAKAIVDALIVVGFLLLMVPKLALLDLHEWGGLAICLFFILHKCLNWSWIKTVTTKLFTKGFPERLRLNYILDLVLLVAFVLITIMGNG
jgi:hypothetical protein